MTAPLSQRQNETDSLRSERDALLAALTPFAEFYSSAMATLPNEHVITQGSGMARKQLTVRELRRAVAAIAALTASKATGERT
jgi:hypothetical protein